VAVKNALDAAKVCTQTKKLYLLAAHGTSVGVSLVKNAVNL